jgi:hypothetical protein
VNNLPVICAKGCGWTGWRRWGKVGARPCPGCDAGVVINRTLKTAEDQKQVIAAREIPAKEWIDDPVDDWTPTPLESYIAETKAPVRRLPNPYYLRTYTGEVQIFRIPAHVKRRKRGARR